MQEALPLLFHLWQTRQLTIERLFLRRGEQIVVAAHISDDSAPSQTILGMFNQFLGTEYSLNDIMREKCIELVSERGTLTIVVKPLWVIDFGDEILPMYEADKKTAEFMASVLEQNSHKQLRSFRQYPNGYEQHPGYVIVFGYSVERLVDLSLQKVPLLFGSTEP